MSETDKILGFDQLRNYQFQVADLKAKLAEAIRQRFSDLPPYPKPGDMFALAESPGHFWVWATPLGQTHPAWVDP